MSEGEFRRYQIYAAKRLLPSRRVEMHLAQIAMLIVRATGKSDVDMSDFLFDRDDEDVSLQEAFEFNPRKREA